MIHKIKPELTIYLAEEALKEKFSEKNINLREVLEIQKDCQDYLTMKNIRKIYVRMMKNEMKKMMVDAVYETLSPEEQEFLLMKYRKKKQMIAISLELNVSVAQLHIRQHSILEKISEFMLYKLTEEDVFNPPKVVTMIILLEKIVEFAERYDSRREFISGGWVEVIAERHDKYCRLLNEIEEIFDNAENSLRKKIIFEKIENPDEKIEVLSERCNVDKSIVSRSLKNFVADAKKYLE